MSFEGPHVSLKLSRTFASSPSTGLSGSMNFDEASEHEDDAEEDRTSSLSPNTDTRPASAASGKDAGVSSPSSNIDHKIPVYIQVCYKLHMLYPGCCHSWITHSRQRANRRGQSRGVRLSSGSTWRHCEMSNHTGQEGHGPRPVPHLLHAHGERGWKESECGPWVIPGNHMAEGIIIRQLRRSGFLRTLNN